MPFLRSTQPYVVRAASSVARNCFSAASGATCGVPVDCNIPEFARGLPDNSDNPPRLTMTAKTANRNRNSVLIALAVRLWPAKLLASAIGGNLLVMDYFGIAWQQRTLF